MVFFYTKNVQCFYLDLLLFSLKTGHIVLVDVKKGSHILQSLRGHDEEVYTLDWCPIPGEDFRPALKKEDDITDLESFGVGAMKF